MKLLDLFNSKLEIFRLEQRYTKRRSRRSTFVSDAVYVDGEYIHAGSPPASPASSTSSSAASSKTSSYFSSPALSPVDDPEDGEVANKSRPKNQRRASWRSSSRWISDKRADAPAMRAVPEERWDDGSFRR